MRVDLTIEASRLRREVAESTRLAKLTQDKPWLRQVLGSVGEHFVEIEKQGDELFQMLAGSHLTKVNDLIYDIAVGKGEVIMTTESVQDLWGIFFDVAQSSEDILATSVLNPEAWWLDEKGRRYLDKNYDAIRRGVKIKRVLVLASDDMSPEEKGLLEEQSSGGIEIRYCERTKCLPELAGDFLVVGNRYAAFLTVQAGTVVRESRFTSSNVRVVSARRDFERLWQRSTPFSS